MAKLEPPHPMQPIVFDEDGRARFKENAIVRYMLDQGGIDMNHLIKIPFDQEERMQFAQLIGYSIDGFAELPYSSDKMIAKADSAADKARKPKKKK